MKQVQLNKTLNEVHDVFVKNKATYSDVIVICEYMKNIALNTTNQKDETEE